VDPLAGFRLDGKVAVVTGASSGLGARFAGILDALGATVVVSARRTDRIDELAGGLSRGQAVTCDVSQRGASAALVSGVVERHGRIDVVVANAGIASYGSVLQVDPEAFKRVMDVNVLGVFHTVRATLPAVIERKGYVLVVSSLAAFAAAPGMIPYDASKAGVEHLANALRLEVAGRGVTVGSAHMSWIDTALVRDSKADLPSFTELLSKLPWPLNKTTSVDDCAAAFVKGIEHRKRRVYCPGWVGWFRWLKPLLSTPAGENAVSKTAAELLPRMDAEVAALGRSTSAYNQELEKG